MTPASSEALSHLRNADHFQWYLVPLLAFVLYVYMAEVKRRDWRTIMVGLLFFGGEFCWEMANGLVLHWTQYAALWSTPGQSAYIILVGLNAEIASMFAVAGIVLVKSLPEDRGLTIAGLSNRIVIPLAWGIFCTLVELALNRSGALVWEWKYWAWPHFYTIFVNYTAPFFLMTWVYDRFSMRTMKIGLAVIVSVDVVLWIVFAEVLRWI